MTGENRRANVEAELAKARSCLLAADRLLSSGLYDDATNRIYYGAHHLVSAALLALGIEVGSHRGLTNQFALHLVKPGHIPAEHSRRLAQLQGLRHHAEYDRHFAVDPQGARDEIAWVEELRAVVERWLASQGFEIPEPDRPSE